MWDTGHQAYPHKLITGRYERFGTLRQLGGVGGFPRRSESEHDVFDGGHAGTGLSIAAGLATARDVRHGMERIAVVVGDAALMSGLSFEALNEIGHRRTQILIVLNDNEMSISQSVGALSKYLSEIKLSNAWKQSRTAYDRTVERVPVVGPTALELSRRVRKSFVSFAQPGQLFEDLGITYIGVVPGHDLRALVHTFRSAIELDTPVIVHVRTQKGRGYHPAEKDQVGFHGAALPPMADTYQSRRGSAASPLGAGEISATSSRSAGGQRGCGGAGRGRVAEGPQLHPLLRPGGGGGGPRGPAHRRDHGRDADWDRPQQVRGGVPGSIRRRRDRRAARGGPGHGDRPRRRATGGGDLRNLHSAGLRPDRPRRLPERRAGPPRASTARGSSGRTGRATRGCSRTRPIARSRTS